MSERKRGVKNPRLIAFGIGIGIVLLVAFYWIFTDVLGEDQNSKALGGGQTQQAEEMYKKENPGAPDKSPGN